MTYEDEVQKNRIERAGKRPQEGVKYKLRVIHGSGGMLELVEEEPPRSWYMEWARLMQHAGWGM